MTTPANGFYDRIYFSPHFDDAVLSCGGQIYQATQAGETVLIVTVTAGKPDSKVRSEFARAQHRSWGLSEEEVITARRAEDIAACRLLGAAYAHWPWPDCIYRLDRATGEPLYRSDEDIFGDLAPAERPLVQEVAEKMGTLPPAGQLFVPLTVGHHVDHQLTRAAAEQQYGDALVYYEDYPYIQRHPQMLGPLVSPESAWERAVIPLSDAALTARIAASGQYRSQTGQLFGDAQRMASLIREQVTDTGGERVWYPVARANAHGQ